MKPVFAVLLPLLAFSVARGAEPAWTTAWEKGPLTADETKAFMRRLAQFVFDHHLKQDPKSAQRGMIYEYFDVARKGQFDQWVQGEGLDTMHDGAWFAAAMVNAFRATGEPFYKELLTKWQLPFYLKMLNHSDELFTNKGAVAREGAKPWDKPWAFQEGEKGFIPYWWDHGASVSLERRQDHNPLPNRPSKDLTVGRPNPNAFLNGYSLGMSNHMAQDIGVMLQLAWLLFKDSNEEADKKLTAEIAEAAKNLHESRMRHHGYIPMCAAPWALASGSADLMKRLPDPDDKALWNPSNHYTHALYDFTPGQRMPFPGFADDQEYRYYFGIARAGGKLPRPLAFKTIYDAYTEPMLFRAYCDDWQVPPGINVFDLYPYYAIDGKPTDYRSQRKGPRGGPKPIGSRFGPQNMVCCGWALQALKVYPGVWEERLQHAASKDPRLLPSTSEGDVKAWLERELGCGLRTWQAVFDEKGYIPTGMGTGSWWDGFSDTGGYAHLVSACAEWLLVLEGKTDWEVHHYPAGLEAGK